MPTTTSRLSLALLLVGLAASGVLVAGCEAEDAVASRTGSEDADRSDPEKAQPEKAVRLAQPLLDANGEPKGLENHRRWSDRIGQGAQPKGEIAFQNIAALGYTTVLTVDGAVPPVALAAKHGLSYVHIPIGYDGIPRDAALRIAKAIAIADGPVYVHCHHGRHRGPAAAMVGRMQVDGVSNDQCRQGLVDSGTSPKYEGLWRDIARFERFSKDDLATISKADLPSAVQPAGVVDAMVHVSHRYEHLKASKALGWKALPDNPDVSAAHEARMLWEQYREMARLDEVKGQPVAYARFLAEAEKSAVALEKALRAGDKKAADEAFVVTKRLCNACHVPYRNNDGE